MTAAGEASRLDELREDDLATVLRQRRIAREADLVHVSTLVADELDRLLGVERAA